MAEGAAKELRSGNISSSVIFPQRVDFPVDFLVLLCLVFSKAPCGCEAQLNFNEASFLVQEANQQVHVEICTPGSCVDPVVPTLAIVVCPCGLAVN